MLYQSAMLSMLRLWPVPLAFTLLAATETPPTDGGPVLLPEWILQATAWVGIAAIIGHVLAPITETRAAVVTTFGAHGVLRAAEFFDSPLQPFSVAFWVWCAFVVIVAVLAFFAEVIDGGQPSA